METLFKLLERLFSSVNEEKSIIFLIRPDLREKSNPLDLMQEAALLIGYISSSCSILGVKKPKFLFLMRQTFILAYILATVTPQKLWQNVSAEMQSQLITIMSGKIQHMIFLMPQQPKNLFLIIYKLSKKFIAFSNEEAILLINPISNS
ncbi:MAG: hypothetical protein ACK5N8_02530 [Alphaproteobacteria bacterium]